MKNLHHLGGNVGGQSDIFGSSGFVSGWGTGAFGSEKIVHLITFGVSLKRNLLTMIFKWNSVTITVRREHFICVFVCCLCTIVIKRNKRRKILSFAYSSRIMRENAICINKHSRQKYVNQTWKEVLCWLCLFRPSLITEKMPAYFLSLIEKNPEKHIFFGC